MKNPQAFLNEAVRVLEDCKRLFDEALPKFNWGASALDANAIELLNEVPASVDWILEEIKKAK